jgi:hypothetical protein
MSELGHPWFTRVPEDRDTLMVVVPANHKVYYINVNRYSKVRYVRFEINNLAVNDKYWQGKKTVMPV